MNFWRRSSAAPYLAAIGAFGKKGLPLCIVNRVDCGIPHRVPSHIYEAATGAARYTLTPATRADMKFEI